MTANASTHTPDQHPAPRIRLVATDLDGTLLGNPQSALRFIEVWQQLPGAGRPLLCFATGRTVEDVHALVRNGRAPEPDVVIGSMGTELWLRERPELSQAFVDTLRASRWSRDVVDEIVRALPGVRVQPDTFQGPHKSSWFLDGAPAALLDELSRTLAERGVEALVVYSQGHFLDVLPKPAGKAGALTWVCERLQIGLDDVLVAGDSGNDASMFLLDGVRGIVVENAAPELLATVVGRPVFRSSGVHAEGLIQGLAHYGIIESVPPYVDGMPATYLPAGVRRLTDDDAFTSLSAGDRELIAVGYEKAIAALRRNVTPLGFTAASIADNPPSGTDANYHAVWARDGALTVIGSLGVKDPDIALCRRETLSTLLRYTTPNGQVPACVRIGDRQPDYSGVGDICAIDAPLWLVIACDNYLAATGDEELLRRHRGTLRSCMRWLEAHDANRDALLEVPEASDWTDQFGRSYHVLYDEVLWCRANVCYGRICERLGDDAEAAAHHQRSQEIKNAILRSFWPSLTRDAGTRGPSFAEMQFSLGDARYLLAEITPFGFNWRCDVLGNVLALLMNVIDVGRARRAFAFMWGVGVNVPWPVANLYPVVHAGAPDWRPYYAVNLLNLPHHYHNGGIWPFIGGMWVRFIHRIGRHDVASSELVRLARLCREGVRDEWEFTEWAHGTTGRPMGKAYQAWSAAAYLRACEELQRAPAHGADAAGD